MDHEHSLTCYLELSGGRRVEVGMTVYAEPIFPTPNEPEVVREPRLDEWAEICGKLAMLQVTTIKSKA